MNAAQRKTNDDVASVLVTLHTADRGTVTTKHILQAVTDRGGNAVEFQALMDVLVAADLVVLRGEIVALTPERGRRLAASLIAITQQVQDLLTVATAQRLRCIFDTNSDGDCHNCYKQGGCNACGGPFYTRTPDTTES